MECALRFTSLAFLGLLSLAAAAPQSVVPSNSNPLPGPQQGGNAQQPIDVVFVNAYNPLGPGNLVPMTVYAATAFPDAGFVGPVVLLTDRDTSNTQRIPNAITYISCDPGDYPGYTNATTLLNNSFNNNVTAVIMYSLKSSMCSFPSDIALSLQEYVYSMKGRRSSAIVHDNIVASSAGYMADIQLHSNDNRFANASSLPGSSTGSPGSAAPSTAVAMVILYSITGVITGLFLIIIVTGAVRAHRHPERYGPRNVLGRPRQSRARGIARAMLDTIPIVKFGEREGAKPVDVELQPSEVGDTVHERGRTDGHTEESHGTIVATRAEDGSRAAGGEVSGIGAAIPVPAANTGAVNGSSTDEALGCSICTDDFEQGEDIRVLPCNHKFHPSCVDPWLLNVSGTCPLCRVDLRPTTTNTSTGTDTDQRGNLAPPLTDAEAGNAMSTGNRRRGTLLSVLNVRRMAEATAEERIAALRRLRTLENNTDPAEAPPEQSTRTRLSSRLQDVFRIRTRRVHSTLQIPANAPLQRLQPTIAFRGG